MEIIPPGRRNHVLTELYQVMVGSSMLRIAHVQVFLCNILKSI